MRARFANLAALLLVPGLAWAQEAGLPFLQNYLPRDYEAKAQNWAVVEDSQGLIYFANNDGVLEYDGVRWRTIPVANRSVVRSLALGQDGRIYVGAQAEFGYLAPGPDGLLQYVSLTAGLPEAHRQFQDVWQTHATSQGIYFTTLGRLFRWRQGEPVRVWQSETAFSSFYTDDALYLSQARQGLFRLNGEAIERVPGGERFAAAGPWCLLAHPRGGLLAVTRDGVFAEERGTFVPQVHAAAAYLQHNQIFSCTLLPDGTAAFGTVRGGVVMADFAGRIRAVVDMASGLQDPTVYALAPDRLGGLWLALDRGVARVETPSPLSYFDERTGARAAPVAIARHEGRLYAADGLGVRVLVPGPAGHAARFTAVPGIAEQAWALLPHESGLLAAATSGVYVIRGGSARLMAKARVVLALAAGRREPDTVYAGGLDGVVRLRPKSGWSAKPVGGASQVVDRIVEDADGTLWLGKPFGDLVRILPDGAVETYGAAAGVPDGAVRPFLVSGQLLFASDQGLLRFAAGRLVPDEVFGKLLPPGASVSEIAEGAGGEIWLGSERFAGRLRPEGAGYRWDPSPLRRPNAGVTSLFAAGSDSVLWAGTTEGILRYDPAVPKQFDLPVRVLLRRVVSAHDGEPFQGGGAVPHSRNALRFEFAAPFFEDESQTRYEAYLDGFDRQRPGWSPEAVRTYTNLPEGGYTLRLRARNLYGAVTEETVFPLTVDPPWYRTWWAFLLYLASAGAAVALLANWRSRQLAAHNRRLQSVVEERTQEIRRQNDALTLLNQEKNEFMGIAAHDMKNPLSAIRGYAEMLREDAGDMDPAEVTDIAHRVGRSANLMLDIVTNLLDINRIEQGLLRLDTQPVDLAATVRQAMRDYARRAEAKRIQLHFNGPEAPPPVLADPGPLGQVLDNLISNAVKYSPPDRNVWLEVAASNGSVRAAVRDEGPGISPEDQKRLFQKFARLTAQPTGGENSTGLGLAIVKRLVEAMNGRVWCESVPGRGAAFILEFPVARPVGEP